MQSKVVHAAERKAFSVVIGKIIDDVQFLSHF